MELDMIKRGLRAEIKKRQKETYATCQTNVRDMCTDVLSKLEEQEKEIAELKSRLEDAKATAYAESVDAGMALRKTQRALWIARADRAKAIKWHEGLERYLQERKKWWPSRFCFMADDEMYHVWYKCWCEVERKCRAKAEQYL